jgi:tetratricopeptide (TPR) repeat protein
MSNTQTFIAHIRERIAQDDVKTAIQQLSVLLKNSPRLDEAVQQSARYNNVLKQIRLGLVDFAAANITQNQIRQGLIDLLREIEEQGLNVPRIKTEVEQYAVNSQKNIVKDNTITARDIHIGDIIQYGERKINRLLTERPFRNDFFIGRETDLAAIETAYQTDNHLLLLINAEGGMGKTTLAAHYWFAHETRYSHLAWVFADSGVGNALVRLAQPLGITFQPQDDERAQIKRITEGVNQLDAPCLLVFDNANQAEDLEKHFVTLKKLTNCHILLTSRVTELGDAPVHRVAHLKKEDAVAVFKKHYPKHQDTEGVLLDSLLHAVGFNTLVIELLAKNLAVFNKFQTQYSLASLVADLQNKGLLALQTKAVKLVYQSDTLRTETPDAIIAAMYDVSALTETEKYLLSNFAVLPAENIPYALFIELLKPDATDTFDTPLSSLQQKGWIEYYEDTTTFKISPVIQDIIKLKNKAALLKDCDKLIDTLIDKLDRDNIHDNNYKLSTVFARYAETILAAFDTPQYNAALLCEHLGTFYTTIGNLEKAIIFYEEYNNFSKQLCYIDCNNADFKNSLAISCQYLGITHTSLGNLDKVLSFFEEYNGLKKELNDTNPTSVEFKNGLAISYQYLGITHTSLGNLDKVLSFFEEYNRLEKELYAMNPTNVECKNFLAISCQYLGNTHTSLGNLDKALSFYEEMNTLFKGLYAANQTNVSFKNGLAISYSKLGVTHTRLCNLDKALTFYEDENKLSEELYVSNPMNVSFKNGLAISYAQLGAFSRENLKDTITARTYFKQAEALWQELVRDAPQFVRFQEFLGRVQKEMKSLD